MTACQACCANLDAQRGGRHHIHGNQRISVTLKISDRKMRLTTLVKDLRPAGNSITIGVGIVDVIGIRFELERRLLLYALIIKRDI